MKIPVKTTVKTLYFGTNKNEQRASTADADFFLLSLRGSGVTLAFNTDRDALHCFS